MKRKKTIVIDAYQYAPTVTGSDRMGYNFLRELQEIDKKNRYYILCSLEEYIPSGITNKNFNIIKPLKLPSVFPEILQRIVNKFWRRAVWARILALRADVYFSFHNMKLTRWRVAKKMVGSVLDLIPLKLEEYKTLGMDPGGWRARFEMVAGMADAFMSISEFSKRELCETLKVDPEKVRVIHLAADPYFDPSKAGEKTTKDLPQNFIFTIGGSEPRKNVMTVAKAFDKLPAALQEKYPLLIGGGAWHGRSLKPFAANEHVKTLGYVDDELLAQLYKNATAFVFASTYEGFGFAILEAMTYGTPVLNATGSSLDEVSGDAALHFDPYDADELAKKLKLALNKKTERERLARLGRQQAKQFSWSHSAKELHELLIS